MSAGAACVSQWIELLPIHHDTTLRLLACNRAMQALEWQEVEGENCHVSPQTSARWCRWSAPLQL